MQVLPELFFFPGEPTPGNFGGTQIISIIVGMFYII